MHEFNIYTEKCDTRDVQLRNKKIYNKEVGIVANGSLFTF